MCRALAEGQAEAKVSDRNLSGASCCPPHINRTPASTVVGRRLTAWAMARQNPKVTSFFYLILPDLQNSTAFWKDPGFRPCVPVIATCQNDTELSGTGGMIRENPERAPKKNLPRITRSAKNLVWTGLGSNPGLQGERPATGHLQYYIEISSYLQENTVSTT